MGLPMTLVSPQGPCSSSLLSSCIEWGGGVVEGDQVIDASVLEGNAIALIEMDQFVILGSYKASYNSLHPTTCLIPFVYHV